MYPSQGIALAGLLIPVALVFLLVWRVKQSFSGDREEVAAFAQALALRGSFDELSLSGTYDGLPLYVTAERVRGDRGVRLYTRVRLLVADPSTYRDAGPSRDTALVARRDEAVPVDRTTGLHELPTGDARFDATYRAFAAPGTCPPWAAPPVRASLLAMPSTLATVERGPLECSVTFSTSIASAAVLRRAVTLAASLTGSQAAQRHAAELASPLDAAPPRRDERAWWAVVRALVVVIVGFVAAFPCMFIPPVHDLTEVVACDDGETLTSVGVSNGRGTTEVCVGPRGRSGANVWVLVVGADIGWGAVLAVFSGIELAVRLGRRGKSRR